MHPGGPVAPRRLLLRHDRRLRDRAAARRRGRGGRAARDVQRPEPGVDQAVGLVRQPAVAGGASTRADAAHRRQKRRRSGVASAPRLARAAREPQRLPDWHAVAAAAAAHARSRSRWAARARSACARTTSSSCTQAPSARTSPRAYRRRAARLLRRGPVRGSRARLGRARRGRRPRLRRPGRARQQPPGDDGAGGRVRRRAAAAYLESRWRASPTPDPSAHDAQRRSPGRCRRRCGRVARPRRCSRGVGPLVDGLEPAPTALAASGRVTNPVYQSLVGAGSQQARPGAAPGAAGCCRIS